jgi:hypothetical protein
MIWNHDSYVSEMADYRLDDQVLILDSGMVSLFSTTLGRLEIHSTFHSVLKVSFPWNKMTKA